MVISLSPPLYQNYQLQGLSVRPFRGYPRSSHRSEPVFLFENLTQHPMEMMHTLLFGR